MVVAVLPQSIKAIIQYSIEKSSFFSFIFQFFFSVYLYARTVPKIYMQEPCQKFICKNRAKNLYARTVPKIFGANENHSCLDLDTVNTNDNHSQTHFGANENHSCLDLDTVNTNDNHSQQNRRCQM